MLVETDTSKVYSVLPPDQKPTAQKVGSQTSIFGAGGKKLESFMHGQRIIMYWWERTKREEGRLFIFSFLSMEGAGFKKGKGDFLD